MPQDLFADALAFPGEVRCPEPAGDFRGRGKRQISDDETGELGRLREEAQVSRLLTEPEQDLTRTSHFSAKKAGIRAFAMA